MKNLIQEYGLFESPDDFADLSAAAQLEILQYCNAQYRPGQPVVDDVTYNVWLTEFEKNDPTHPFLQGVEDDTLSGDKVRLPAHMLSTDKVYDGKALTTWAGRIARAAEKLNLPLCDVEIRLTPKLDGFAAYVDMPNHAVFTRGNGRTGTDISHVMFRHGVRFAEWPNMVHLDREQFSGPGEIVVNADYFQRHLSQEFDNTRNCISAVISQNPPECILKAIQDGGVVFAAFLTLPCKSYTIREFMALIETNGAELNKWWDLADFPFETDGLVFECTHHPLKSELGSTSRHHRWQVALKANTDVAQTGIRQVLPQTSRTGKVTPVAILDPVRLCGATINRATCHHYGMVRDQGIAPGALVEIVRAGQVIPHIERVIAGATPDIPTVCPSCGSTLLWADNGDTLHCINSQECPDQIIKSMVHFFATIPNCDGFGPATCEVLFNYHIRTLPSLYTIGQYPTNFMEMGFGEKESQNMTDQLRRSRVSGMEDFRFLTALGGEHLGLATAEEILRHYPLETVFQLTQEQLMAVKGIGKKTAPVIASWLYDTADPYRELMAHDFQFEVTPLASETADIDSPISGMTVVFTGSMEHGSRDDMIARAKTLGAHPSTSLSKKTDLLVVGANPGDKKIKAAEEYNIPTLTELSYLELIGDINA